MGRIGYSLWWDGTKDWFSVAKLQISKPRQGIRCSKKKKKNWRMHESKNRFVAPPYCTSLSPSCRATDLNTNNTKYIQQYIQTTLQITTPHVNK